ncbi:hypothetical protein OG369_42850 [Streptomyces sp. NBC_01221]|uniref:hypothetical protein n=1 Tax=Streptomyces sp. NBC_01221 TaxID=2903782 RepID=UPI002251D17B|nr:hypothetical protein [Streptomyces sp. NBC_01221]MCX4792518.1 hypothetical protein [Streptomyces sp. NBC_01221]
MTNIPDGIRALIVALLQMGGDELRAGQPGARITITSLNTGTPTPWEDCYSVNMDAELLARVIKALGGPAGVSPVRGVAAQPAPEVDEPSEWSAAAVAHNHSQIYADVQDLFDEVDPASYLDDVVNADCPEAAEAAYEQLVTGEWDGEL